MDPKHVQRVELGVGGESSRRQAHDCQGQVKRPPQQGLQGALAKGGGEVVVFATVYMPPVGK